jgi:hypothetical protein
VNSEKRPQPGRRRFPARRQPLQFSLFFLFVLMTICAVVLKLWTTFPDQSFILMVIVAIAVVSVVAYIGELMVLGWITDFLLWISTPAIRVGEVCLQYELAGEIMVVTLSDNIITRGQCRSVQKQLAGLLGGHHCDFILDFSGARRISSRFREVMIRLMKEARTEADRIGKPYRPVPTAPGDLFRVFDDRKTAVEEMGRHDGHGWVVLCCVPAGVRAVPEAT